MPVRIGYPAGISGKVEDLHSPRCTTAVGLVMFGRNKRDEMSRQESTVMTRVKDWIKKIM